MLRISSPVMNVRGARQMGERNLPASVRPQTGPASTRVSQIEHADPLERILDVACWTAAKHTLGHFADLGGLTLQDVEQTLWEMTDFFLEIGGGDRLREIGMQSHIAVFSSEYVRELVDL